MSVVLWRMVHRKGRPLLWAVLNFQSVDQLVGFEPVSDSEAEVDGFEVMW